MAQLSALDHVQKTISFGGKTRKRSLRQLAVYIEQNIPIVEALRQMSRFASHDGQKPYDFPAKVYGRWAKMIAAGERASKAMEGYIPEFERQIIVAADEYGKLENGIRDALEIRDGLDQIRSVLRKALIYPVLLMAGVIGFFIYMAKFVLPGYHEALPDTSKWPASVARLEFASSFFNDNIVLIVGTFVGAFALVMWLMPRWTGRTRAFFDNFPPFSMYRIVFGTIFLMSLSGYVKAGMTEVMIVRAMLKNAGPWYAERLRSIMKEIKGGQNMGEALQNIGYEFPDRQVIEDLRVFSQYKGFEVALTTLGKEMLRESVERISSQTAIIGYVSLFVMTGLMLWFINAIFDFQHAVGSALSGH